MKKIREKLDNLPVQTHTRLKILFYVLMLLCSVVATFYMLPRSVRFNLNYEEGKPWEYDLLMAEYDFPIYKSEKQLKYEYDSVLRYYYIPYYNLNNSVFDKMSKAMASELSADAQLYHRLNVALRAIYRQGVMDFKAYEKNKEQGIKRINVIDSSRMVVVRDLGDLYTARTAYDYLCAQCGSADVAHHLNLNRFITDNLTIDRTKSTQAQQALFDKISLTEGMVQQNQRIIGKGEIIDSHTFKILNSLKRSSTAHTSGSNNNGWVAFGEVLFIVALFTLMLLYLYLFRPRIFFDAKKIFFILLMIVCMLGLVALVVRFTKLSVYVVPFALLPIMVRAFFDSRTALFAHIIAVVLTSLMVAVPYEFIVLQIIIGIVTISSLVQMMRRSQLVQTALLVFVSYSISYIGLTLAIDGDGSRMHWIYVAYFAVNGLLLFFSYVLIFIFEKLFGFLSDVTLVELSNVNSKLLMDFSNRAPGSFQHVLQVANLSAACADRIKANVLLARTGALYHDIGKITNPMLFTENQAGGVSPLADMPYEKAAQIVINHVAEGVKIAQKAHLPYQIIRFIRTHHAQSKTLYFYNSYKNQYPDRPIDESLFTYPGPLPRSKEEAIVMMADSVEAASRSLKSYDAETIGCLVEKIVNAQIAEHALRDSYISFREVEYVKTVFKNKLLNIYHTRISYPELQRQKQDGNEATVKLDMEDDD